MARTKIEFADIGGLPTPTATYNVDLTAGASGNVSSGHIRADGELYIFRVYDRTTGATYTKGLNVISSDVGINTGTWGAVDIAIYHPSGGFALNVSKNASTNAIQFHNVNTAFPSNMSIEMLVYKLSDFTFPWTHE